MTSTARSRLSRRKRRINCSIRTNATYRNDSAMAHLVRGPNKTKVQVTVVGRVFGPHRYGFGFRIASLFDVTAVVEDAI